MKCSDLRIDMFTYVYKWQIYVAPFKASRPYCCFQASAPKNRKKARFLPQLSVAFASYGLIVSKDKNFPE